MQILTDRPVSMDEYQLATIAEAHIAMKTDLAFEVAQEFHTDLDEVRHKNWFKLAVMHRLIKDYNLGDMGI